MTTPASPAAPAGTGTAGTGHDLDSASRAHAAATAPPRQAKAPVDEVAFFGQLSFLVTVGYLTNPQAAALIDWFNSHGATPLPALPGPTGAASPSMYELLGTSIHFGTPAPAGGVADFDIGDFFSSLLDGVSDLVTTVCDGVTQVLGGATALVQATTVLVQQLQTF